MVSFIYINLYKFNVIRQKIVKKIKMMDDSADLASTYADALDFECRICNDEYHGPCDTCNYVICLYDSNYTKVYCTEHISPEFHSCSTSSNGLPIPVDHSDESVSCNALLPCDSISAFSGPSPMSSKSTRQPIQSEVWLFFQKPSSRREYPEFLRCLICSRVVKANPCSTSNLSHHARRYHGSLYDVMKNARTCGNVMTMEQALEEVAKMRNSTHHCSSTASYTQLSIKGAFGKSEVDVEGFYSDLIDWIVVRDHSFEEIESHHFQRLFRHGVKNPKLFSADTVKRRLMNRYEVVKQKLINVLTENECKKSLTCDVWTNISQEAFLSVTVHYIQDNFTLRSHTIAVRHVIDTHTGENLANLLDEVLLEYGLRDQILTITLDNASNNDTMVAKLIELGILHSNEHHVRCFAHVLNLVAKSAILSFEDKVLPVRKLLEKIKYSQNLNSQFKKYCQLENVPYRKVVLDVATRWNSMDSMLKYASEMEKPLVRLIDVLKKGGTTFFTRDDFARHDLVQIATIEKQDFEKFRVIRQILQPIAEATNLMGGQSYPSFQLALPLYNSLMDSVEDSEVCVATKVYLCVD